MSNKGGLPGKTVVVVRPAGMNDIARLGIFFMRAWREAGPGALGFTGATDESIKEIASEEFLAKRLASPNARLIVAEDRGEILGFASIRNMRERGAELSGVVVLESAAGKGLGSKLVRKACQVALKLGSERLMVKTEVVNQRAIGFYKKNGFTEATKASEKVGRTKVPVQVLERRLK